MNRREFVKFIALIAAGVAANPKQIEAFERYYEANTPLVDSELVAIDEIIVSGMANKLTPVKFELLSLSKTQPMVSFGFNLLSGCVRWVAAPDQKIILPHLEVSWNFTPEPEPDLLVGHVSFVDQNAKRHYQPITAMNI